MAFIRIADKFEHDGAVITSGIGIQVLEYLSRETIPEKGRKAVCSFGTMDDGSGCLISDVGEPAISPHFLRQAS